MAFRRKYMKLQNATVLNIAYDDHILWQMKSEPWTKDKFIFVAGGIEIQISYVKKTHSQKIADHFYQTNNLSH